MFKENFLEVSLLLEPHHEERVDIAQEYGIDIMKFALMQAIFDECFLSEKHIQYIPPFALFFLILPGDGGYHLAHYICAYLLDSCLAP